MTTLPEVDIVRVMLTQGYENQGRDASYNLVGDYSVDSSVCNGGVVSMDEITWLHPTDPKPTEQNLIDWEDARVAAINADNADKLSIQTDMFALSINRPMIVVIAGLNADVAKRFIDGTATTLDQMITFLENRISQNATLQSAVQDYVEALTVDTWANLKLTDAGKKDIWVNAMAYLTIIALTWDARGQQ